VKGVGFTGPLELSEAGARLVRRTVAGLDDFGCFVSGAAYGVDTAAALAAAEFFPEAAHRVYVPRAWHNERAVVQLRERGAEVIEIAAGVSGPYMARNDAMVADRDVEQLVGFPHTCAERLRSGTWATIRRARKAGLRIVLHPLSETEATVVHCRKEPYDVYIGRGRDPRTDELGAWGNPFTHRRSQVRGVTIVASRDEAIERYRRYLWDEIGAGRISSEQLAALHGKALGCWCAPEACHGEVLARAAAWAANEAKARRG
jgi:hypothetical protein